MTTPLNADALLTWCLTHILCDACQIEGGKFQSDSGKFICDADLRYLRLLLRSSFDDEEPDD